MSGIQEALSNLTSESQSLNCQMGKIPRLLHTQDSENPEVTGFKGTLVPSSGKVSTLMIQTGEAAGLRS